jgi:hypothetical protein
MTNLPARTPGHKETPTLIARIETLARALLCQDEIADCLFVTPSLPSLETCGTTGKQYWLLDSRKQLVLGQSYRMHTVTAELNACIYIGVALPYLGSSHQFAEGL